jgi:glycosyltransferase involved in cell wall biosynthesis
MRVWLLTIGEPLPTDGGNERLLRAGILAETLLTHGHEVLWWTSTFDHIKKRHRFDTDVVLQVRPGYRIRLLHSVAYKHNVSFRRILNHNGVARKFARLANTERAPDVMVCSWPPIELCKAATGYGLCNAIPTVLDVRDLWPDVFLDLVPSWARAGARLMLSPLFRDTSVAFHQATALMGLTTAFLDWALSHAGREYATSDRVFPMAYPTTTPTDESLTRADVYWKERGINENGDEFVACFFGSMGRHIDLKTVIEAARLLQGHASRFKFVLCGTGGNCAYYRRLVSGVDNVLLPGWVGMAEIWTLMRRSSVGLAPYKNTPNYIGNIPNKPIEYLSAKLPIVSSLSGVLQDLLWTEDCGLTYEPNSPSSLANTLDSLSSNRTRLSRMSFNAGRLYDREFVAEKVYTSMVHHLENLVEGARTTCKACPRSVHEQSCDKE